MRGVSQAEGKLRPCNLFEHPTSYIKEAKPQTISPQPSIDQSPSALPLPLLK
jgi:hypothetical protein